MRYEIIHDTIAKQVFEKASTEARTRRKMEKYVRDKHEMYLDRGVLLSQDDVDYLTPFLDAVSISREEEAFIAKSKKALRRQARRRRMMVAGVIAVLTVFLAGAVWQWVEANSAKDKALKETKRATQAEEAARDSERVAKNERVRALVLADIAQAAAKRDSLSRLAAEQSAREAEVQARIADERARIANSRRLATQADARLDAQLDLALLLAVQAYRTDSGVEAQSSLLRALGHSPQLKTFLHSRSKDAVQSLAFSRDGRLATGGVDGTITLWTPDMRRSPTTLKGGRSSKSSIAFGPNGKYLASGSKDGTITLWEGERTHQLPRVQEEVTSLAFSPSGGRLASGSQDGSIVLWSIDDRAVQNNSYITQQITQDRPQEYAVYVVAFSPDGKYLASGSAERTIILWEVDSGEPCDTLTGHRDWVSSLAFSPDSTHLASGSKDGVVILWDADTRDSVMAPNAHRAGVKCPAFSRETTYGLKEDEARVNSLAFSPDGKRLALGGSEGAVKLLDVQAGDAPAGHQLTGHQQAVESVAFSLDGEHLASVSEDGAILIQYVEKPALAVLQNQRLEGHELEVYSLAFSPDGRYLASGAADSTNAPTIKLWEVETEDLSKSLVFSKPLEGHPFLTRSVAFSRDGERLAFGGNQGNKISMRLVKDGKLIEPGFEGHDREVISLAFSPDGKFLAFGSRSRNDTGILWDVATGDSLRPLTERTDIYSVAFSPDGKYLASGGNDGAVILWSADGDSLRALKEHGKVVNSLAFSPDGKYLASGSADNTVILWDVATGESLGTLTGGDRIFSVAFGPDGILAAGDATGTISLWDVNLTSWVKRACRLANRNLSAREWTQFMGGPYRCTCPDLPCDDAAGKQ